MFRNKEKDLDIDIRTDREIELLCQVLLSWLKQYMKTEVRLFDGF